MKNNQSLLSVEHLFVTYQDDSSDLQALSDVSFTLANQEFLSVIGPSGSGKSTLLRVLAGLISPTEGKVLFHQNETPLCISVVFQQANLMPWRTVLGNIQLPLEVAGMDSAMSRKRAEEMAELVGMKEFLNVWPAELSGGMAQRVAIARALIQEPDLLLLDEPFGALDALTRERMGTELLRIWQTSRKAVVLVTHSISEALLLSDRVLVLTPRPGKVVNEITVPFPRPRSEEIRYTPSFIQLERQLRNSLQ